MTTTSGNVPMVTPADVRGPRQGQWTYKDYAALPDNGQRYEIIDGVIFMTPAPTEWHQTVVGRFFRYLAAHIEDTGRGRVYIAPLDVELAPYVVVQPDVIVILKDNREKITPSRIVGAPDLVIEVASPGTADYDRREKQDSYARAGVPEYWIADPSAHTIIMFVLETAGTYRSLGLFEGQALLPSEVVKGFAIPVERFFAQVP